MNADDLELDIVPRAVLHKRDRIDQPSESGTRYEADDAQNDSLRELARDRENPSLPPVDEVSMFPYKENCDRTFCIGSPSVDFLCSCVHVRNTGLGLE